MRQPQNSRRPLFGVHGKVPPPLLRLGASSGVTQTLQTRDGHLTQASRKRYRPVTFSLQISFSHSFSLSFYLFLYSLYTLHVCFHLTSPKCLSYGSTLYFLLTFSFTSPTVSTTCSKLTSFAAWRMAGCCGARQRIISPRSVGLVCRPHPLARELVWRKREEFSQVKKFAHIWRTTLQG